MKVAENKRTIVRNETESPQCGECQSVTKGYQLRIRNDVFKVAMIKHPITQSIFLLSSR